MVDPNPTNQTGFPFGIASPGLGMMAVTNPLTLPQTASKTIFTVAGGSIRVLEIFGFVTVAIGAVANATKLTIVPATTPVTPVDVCATLDINALAIGNLLIAITGFSTALSAVTSGYGPVASSTLPTTFICRTGNIQLNCAGSDGGLGMIKWHMRYIPLNTGLSQAGLCQVSSPLS